MNARLAAVLGFALVVAAVSSGAVYYFVSSASSRPALAQTKLLVASHDLDLGSLIREADLREIPWTGDAPANSMTNTQEVIGRGVVAVIYKDEPIFAGRLASKGAGAGLAAIIPIGKRAVALRVNEVVGLAGFVQPGMHVDVLIAGNAPSEANSRSGVLSRTILQNIEVLSAGQKIEKSPDGKPEDVQVVNLLVSPEQAEILSLAASEMKVQLVLRNPMDTQEKPTRGTSIASLFGEAPRSDRPVRAARTITAAPRVNRPPMNLAPPLPAEPETIEVFTGIKKTQQQLVVPGGAQ